MRVFLTGATGFLGSHIIPELIDTGHQVLGLTRSEAGAEQLRKAGAEVHPGNIEDLDSLRSGAAAADGTIHCGFNHDFSNFAQNCENDRLAIEAMGEALAGTGKPFVITSGVGMGTKTPGEPATEDVFDAKNHNPRVASEVGGRAASNRGVNVSVVRLPQVHDTTRAGLISLLIPLFREKGVSAYVGEGANHWSAVHVLDAARLYCLALEKREAGSVYNAVAEEGVSARDIAEVLGRGLHLPVKSLSAEEAADYFGWMSMFAGVDLSASSKLTRDKLNWHPTGPGLLADLEQMDYASA